MNQSPKEKAVKVAGGQSALARLLNVKPQAVQQWEFIPESRALDIERVTNGQVTAKEILEYACARRLKKCHKAAA